LFGEFCLESFVWRVLFGEYCLESFDECLEVSENKGRRSEAISGKSRVGATERLGGDGFEASQTTTACYLPCIA
jgi:hypothetical protein